MLWNWETIDACFLTERWRIKSQGGFAGLCIGVILMVILLEALRRASKEYDNYLDRQHRKSVAMATVHDDSNSTENGDGGNKSTNAKGTREQLSDGPISLMMVAKDQRQRHPFDYSSSHEPFRPSVAQQAVRALLHTFHFALAYWIMLMAMYYNGFIIICIIIGAFVGAFVFQWERIGGDQ